MEIDGDTPNLTDYMSANIAGGSIAKNTEVIDISDYRVSKKESRLSNTYNKDLCRDNKPLTDFINKCLFLDPTKGMEAVINKVLLPSYAKADKEYKESNKFKRVITKAFQKLIDNPGRKYSHINNVVDTLKFHVETPPQCNISPVKKRVNFITLSTKVSVKSNDRKRPMIQSSSRICLPKKSKSEVIALDCDDDDEVIPIDDEANEDNSSNQVKVDHKRNSQTEEENFVNGDTDIIEIQDSQEVKIADEKESDHSVNRSNGDKSTPEHIEAKSNEIEHEKENLGSNENLLVPHKEKIIRLEKPKLKKKEPEKKPEEMTEVEKTRRIRIIEAKIEKYNKTIAQLNLEEVTDDSLNSPYHKCDRLQAAIVKLYKELCTLVGEEPPKKRKIQLQIKEGVPQGPIKRLETFLNKRADAEGETPFPDFSDVIRCVEKANEVDGLGWSKAKIMKEAQSIFTYCGRALQKKRQQREWKHLRALARPEEFEADPAETDMELQARLEANRRLASQREAEVFNKYTQLADVPEPLASTSFAIEEPPDLENSSSDEETEPTHPIILKESNSNDNVTSNVNETEVVVKQEPEEVPIKIQYQGDVSLVIIISDSESEEEYGVLTF